MMFSDTDVLTVYTGQASQKHKHLPHFTSGFVMVCFQGYSEWKKEKTDVCIPPVHINSMDHLTSYIHVVTDPTQELCDLILSSYKEELGTLCKRGERTYRSCI